MMPVRQQGRLHLLLERDLFCFGTGSHSCRAVTHCLLSAVLGLARSALDVDVF